MRRLVLEVLAGAVLLGCAAGVAWVRLAPTLSARFVDEAGAAVVEGATSDLFARQAVLGVLLLGAGVVLGAAVWPRHRRRRVAATVLLTVGGVLGAVLAWRLGVAVGPQRPTGTSFPVGTALELPLELDAPGVLLLWPIGSLVVVLLLNAALREPAGSPAKR